MTYPSMLKIVIIYLFFTLSAAYASDNLFTPLPEIIKDVSPAKVALGKRLFNDPKLSENNTIACSSCHILEKYGMDSMNTSVGVNGQKGKRNTPSIWNARYNFVQTWDGRNRTLFDQVIYAIENPFEMNQQMDSLVMKLRQDDIYLHLFKQNYQDGIIQKNIADALVHFIKTLVTPDSNFDRYLQGEKDILTDKELTGYRLFQSKGCIACHNGISLGGNLYQKLGVFDDSKAREIGDYGRNLVTKKNIDKYYFKVPGLRNIEKTAPYLHNGSVNSLEKVVKLMAELQLGQQLNEKEVKNIVAFLKTLTGKIPASVTTRQ